MTSIAEPFRRRVGIDEAGYGPILGPLSIVLTLAEISDEAAFAHAVADYGVDDSKALHDSRDVSRLESVALAAITWLTGSTPNNAAALFALFQEGDTQRGELPWSTGAEDLRLPLAATIIPTWTIARAQPLGVYGALIHPSAMNHGAGQGRNRAHLEWDAIGAMLAQAAQGGPVTATCDRLGGRRYYQDPLAGVFPWCPITVLEESRLFSRYTVEVPTGMVAITFAVGGERVDPLVAVASCIAKYAREVHMHLSNAWWGQRCAGLRPTAGYGSDAQRWLGELPSTDRSTFSPILVRGNH